ncbi:PPC domain-containing DNA-binding protein [Candidatus Methanoplasma termitum]|nr:PPC domain-containing DNA-binding protein [Candidatus Methanoplasma termitum]
MRSLEMERGRTFVLRLETGEVLHEVLESFCRKNGIQNAYVSVVGGIGEGSRMTVGPEMPYEKGIVPIVFKLDAPHELTASGTIFPDEDGSPMVHIHGSAGREGRAVTGCLRTGVIAWLVLEVVLIELIGEGAVRKKDKRTGIKILEL